MNMLFTHLSSPRITAQIRTAKKRVCYAAPGIGAGAETKLNALIEAEACEFLEKLAMTKIPTQSP